MRLEFKIFMFTHPYDVRFNEWQEKEVVVNLEDSENKPNLTRRRARPPIKLNPVD